MTITYSNIYSDGTRDAAVDSAFDRALDELRHGEPFECLSWIGNERIGSNEWLDRQDPAHSGVVVSRCSVAGQEVVEKAVLAARVAWPDWRQRSMGDRMAVLSRAAELFRRDRIKLAARGSLETGKTRADALAEVDECAAILELYVRQLTAEAGYRVSMAPPAADSQAYVELRPYGVFGVVGPFNFPFAIPLGMAAAALVMGNTVVLKPSPMTPACGEALAEILFEAGVPQGALSLLFGCAETGRALTASPIDGMAFTGSAEVGLAMHAQLVQPPHSRPLIAEMGGKNPAIVTGRAADLKVAATAVARSAFGMSGQKCNACSRVVVTEDVYDDFLAHLVKVVEGLTVGDPGERGAFTGPVINDVALTRFEKIVAAARTEGRIAIGGKSNREEGFYAELTVVADLPYGHWVTREEHFLPVLTVTRVSDFGAALREANNVEYGLSAGIFTADEGERAEFLDVVEAGIVFVNNPGGATTGVWPGGQTMSGWKASGATGKGGFGPWYLQQYAREQSRTIYN